MENKKIKNKMNATKKVVMNLYEDYVNVFVQEYIEENDLNVNVDDVLCNKEIMEKDIRPIIEDDLLDKNFSTEEVNEIWCKEMSEKTLYKLGAYMIASFNQPETFEEWKTSIKEDVEVKLPKEECLKLWNSYQEIDF